MGHAIKLIFKAMGDILIGIGPFLLKVLGIFALAWVIWYVTGGPMRSNDAKPFVAFNSEGTPVFKDATTTRR